MITEKIRNLLRFTLAQGGATYILPHAMGTAPEVVIKQVGELGVTAEDFFALTKEEAKIIGFNLWDEDQADFLLIPQWLYYVIPEGMLVTNIGGEEKPFSRKTHDYECRFNSLSYGLHFVETNLNNL